MNKLTCSLFLCLTLTQALAQADSMNDSIESLNEHGNVSLVIHGSPLTLLTNEKKGHRYIGHINVVNTSELKVMGVEPYLTGTSMEGQIKIMKNTCKKGIEPNAVCSIEFSANHIPVSQTSVLLRGANIVDTPIDIQIKERSDALGFQLYGGRIISLSDKNNPFDLILSSISSNDYWIGNTTTQDDKILKKHATSTKNGANNTKTLVSLGGNGRYAAQVCAAYSINSDGVSPCTGTLGEICYHDWYLPAKNELNVIYQNWESVGGVHGYYDWYWSSTYRASWHDAWVQSFGSGGEQRSFSISGLERHRAKVRCVRSF